MIIETPSGIKKHLPVAQWLPRYPSEGWRPDLVAGLTTAAVVIPQAMAYATIAGMPVEAGLYAALVPMLAYAMLGTSRVLSVSVTSTISILTATALAPVVQGGGSTEYLTAASTLALLVGGLLILAGLFRLGFLANLISQPVLIGFKAGVGVVIFTGQIAKVLGVSIDKGPFVQTVIALFESLEGIHWTTFGVALSTLAVLILLPRVAPRVPAALVAVVLGIAGSALLNLEARGVALVGNFPPGLPSLSLPDLALLRELGPAAVGIALICFIESYAAGKSFRRKDEPVIDADQELLALGVANVSGGLFQAYPGGGGTSQTAVNRRARAKTQLSSITTAVSVTLTLLFLASLISRMPLATLGAIVMVAAAGLIKVRAFRAIRHIRSIEFAWAIVAFVGVVLLGSLEGILIAVVISLLTVFYQASYPPVYALGRKPGTHVFRPLSAEHSGDETFPGLLMVRTEGRMLFSSAPNTTDEFWDLVDEAEPQIVAIDCSAIPDLEYTALKLLTEFEEQLSRSGITLWLAALNPEPLKIIERSPLGERLGDQRLFFNMQLVVESFQAGLARED
jgi:high affinity sulfate transporter 1